MASNERVVEFAVKARDDYSKVLKNIQTQQDKLSAASQASNRRSVLGVAESDLQAAVDNYKRLTSEVARYQAALDNGRQSGTLAANEMKELAETIALTRSRSLEAIDAINQHRSALNQMQGGAVTGYAAFNRLADSMQKEAAAAEVSASAALAAAVADERATKAATLKAQIQERLNTATESGFGNWQRYIDTVNRVRAADEKATAVATLKAQIQERLNNPTTSGFAAFIRAAEGAEQEAAAVSGATTQLNKMAVASKAAATAQGVLAKANRAASTSTALSPSGVKGEAQNISAFGLKPYQLTNLGYQINDVISGLASGQKPLQILSQQAGQFVQIWPGVMSTLARSIPIIAGVTAVLAPFVAAALRLKTASDSLEIFNKELAISADGSRYSAQELVKITDQMDAFGISTSKARALVKQFISEGVNQKDFAPLAEMAQRLSAISGDDVVESGKKLATAFSGTVDTVRDLDKELNFLTASQYAQIEAMAKAGNTAGAVSLAQDILAGKLATTASQTTSWGEAAIAAGKAWNGLLDIIEKSGLLSVVGKQLDQFGTDLENAANDLVRNVKQAKGVINTLTGNVDTTDLDAVKAKLMEINAELAAQAKLLEAGQTVYADTSALEAQRAALADIVQLRQDELQAIKDGSAEQKAAADQTEADRKARLDIQTIIDKQGKSLTDETRQAQLTNRERYIEGELLKAKNSALEEAKRLNQDILGLTAEQTKQITAQAGLAYDSTHVNYEAQYTSQRGTPQGAQMAEIVTAVTLLADKMQLSAKDLLTAISFETKGTFNPSIMGGAGGKYAGLFQASPDVQAKYGIDQNSSATAQVEALGKYLQAAGVKGGDTLLQIYAAINAGNAKNINASDEKNGGTPGTVLDKVSDQMSQHADKAAGLLAAYQGIADQAKKTQDYEKDFTARTDAAKAELDYKTQETKQAAVNKAVVDETNRAKKAGVELTQQQLDLVKQQAGAEFDRAHADDQVNQLVAQRTALFQSLQIAQAAGDQGKVASTIDQIGQVEEKLKSAIPAAIAFWQAIGGAGADQEIAKLRAIQEGIGQTLQKLDKQFLPQAQHLNEELADIGGNAFSAFAQAIANGENAAQAFFTALQQGIADFLIEIGKAIVKQAIFNAISGGSGAGGSGGIGGSIAGWITSLFHEGGMIGSASASGTQMVNPAIFANAQRHHTGGIMGLKSNEVPIIGLRGEEVLTEDDPRHAKNGGGRGQASNTKVVNVFDPADVLEAALQDVAGQRIIMNYMTRNSQKLTAALQGG